MRAVLYMRLSKTTEESTSIERQRRDLEALCEREGWSVVAELEDDGISGGKRRARADEALAMLRDGRADVLCVWKLDRWSRQGLSAIADLVDVLDERGLFVAYMDGLRSDQTAWRLIAAVLSEVARAEREHGGSTAILTAASGDTAPMGRRVAHLRVSGRRASVRHRPCSGAGSRRGRARA